MARAGSSKPVPPSPQKLSRIERVEELLISGARPTRLVETVMREHEVSERQVWDDVKAIRDRWAKESETERPQKRAEMLAQIEDLYGRCIEAGDRKTAVQTLQLKADLHGLRVRPMAAIVSPDAKPKDIDTWLSGVLGFGTKAPESDDSDTE